MRRRDAYDSKRNNRPVWTVVIERNVYLRAFKAYSRTRSQLFIAVVPIYAFTFSTGVRHRGKYKKNKDNNSFFQRFASKCYSRYRGSLGHIALAITSCQFSESRSLSRYPVPDTYCFKVRNHARYSAEDCAYMLFNLTETTHAVRRWATWNISPRALTGWRIFRRPAKVRSWPLADLEIRLFQ